MGSKRIEWAAWFSVASLCCGDGIAFAATGDVDVHGFGYQDYFQTTANTYMDADRKGTWDNNFLGLVGTFTLNDKSQLWAQLETSSTDSTRFTWFFVDYQFTAALRAHVGRVKLPLGVYNEIIDVKFLQLSSLEPALYQQAADFVHDAYTGVGIDYDQSLGSAGSITWQVYGGNTYDTEAPVDRRDRRTFGGRVTYLTPVDGLRFLLSAYRTNVEVLATGQLVNETRWIASVDFVREGWDVKSEYGTHKFQGVSSDAYYVQVGRTLIGKWTPFARYDYVTTDKALRTSDSFSQKIAVLGIDYKIKNNVSLRFEDQFNRGYALPVASGEVAANGGKRDWSLLIAGVNFAF